MHASSFSRCRKAWLRLILAQTFHANYATVVSYSTYSSLHFTTAAVKQAFGPLEKLSVSYTEVHVWAVKEWQCVQILYGILLTRRKEYIDHPVTKRFHIRVLIPCYNESLEMVSVTALAARRATLPPGVRRTGEAPPIVLLPCCCHASAISSHLFQASAIFCHALAIFCHASAICWHLLPCFLLCCCHASAPFQASSVMPLSCFSHLLPSFCHAFVIFSYLLYCFCMCEFCLHPIHCHHCFFHASPSSWVIIVTHARDIYGYHYLYVCTYDSHILLK